MTLKNKESVLILALGFVIGWCAVWGGGIFLFGIKKEISRPKRYDAKTPRELKGAAKTGDAYEVFAASSLDRIFKDGKTLLKPAFSESVSIAAARHEYEPFQIVVKTGSGALSAVSLEISDLTHDTAQAKIDKSLLTWRVVGYVPTVEPYYPTKFVGYWPDPLMSAQPTDVKPETYQPFWISVYVPPETLPGTYRGHVKVKSGDQTIGEIPLQLRVYEFTLPKQGKLKTAFDFYGHETHTRYSRGEKESDETYKARIADLNDKFIIEMLKYRINPILNVNPTSERDLGKVDRYLWFGLNNFSIGKRGGTLGNNWPKDDGSIEKLLGEYRTYGEMLKLNKMLQYNYIYTWDEGKIGNPLVAKLCSMIHRAYPGLKNMVCYHGFWDPDQNPEWGKDIDIWTFQIDSFNERLMKKLQTIGKEIWMYVSGPGGSGAPNLALDFDSIDYRIIPWLCWKYDIKGFLYWCVNWWPLADPFKTAANTKWEQNGNGLLFYPGKDGPIASLRLEIFRDGMEDYEYMWMLIQQIKEVRKRGLEKEHANLIQESFQILTVDSKIAESLFSFTKDGTAIINRRNAVAGKIEEFNRILSKSSSQIQEGQTPDAE